MSAPLSARRLAHAPIALVTGASAKAGMGRASAVLLARHGAKVVVTDLPAMEARGAETVEQIEKEGGKATWLPLDVAREGDWEAAIAATEKKWGPLDILVSNAGIGTNEIDPPQNLTSHPTEIYRKILSVNQDGVYFGIKHGAKSMLKRGDKSRTASLINFSSVAGLSGTGTPYGSLAYTASKWAVRGMTKQSAVHFGPLGIRINSIHPGPIETEIWENFKKDPEVWKQVHGMISQVTPLKRTAKPEEVATAVLYLASDDASYVNGTEIVVDGGFMAANGLMQQGV